LGKDKTVHRLKERFYWPGHSTMYKNGAQLVHPVLQESPILKLLKLRLKLFTAAYPTQIIAVDLVGPLPESGNKNSYIMMVDDYCTWWMEAIPIPNQEASTVAAKLVDEVFLRFSVPEQLHTDQGRQFESQLMSEVCKLLRIHKTRTTPYHLQCALWKGLMVQC